MPDAIVNFDLVMHPYDLIVRSDCMIWLCDRSTRSG